ncbi:hypothetical protein GJ629_07550 [Halapricum sp. CBA1109]|uniref:hypothetical protein n=1 Tax=Halapricum sp. CBA1109 TaxID=2668068 RepID=UPI0012F8A583|nr:hypothetical protein [Halapricum sp. CBA1109]MUV89767.1 hypothetical protein [Halapricum sp. CBA1109]
MQDPRTANSESFATNTTNPNGDTITNYTNAINLLGPSDGGPDGLIEVLPLTTQNSSRIVNGERLGNDTFQDFDGMTAYRLKVELRDRANDVIYPGTNAGNVSEIRLEGAGVDGTVNGVNPGNLALGSPSQNLLSGPIFDGQDHYVVFRPTNADEVDETITVEVNISGTGSDTDLTQEINVSGLYVDEFDVDGESDVDAVEPNSQVNVTAVVRDAQEGDAPINNGRVRVSQNSTAIGQVDARTANVNDGQYTFNDLQVGPRGVDTDGDGIGEEASQLVFTAYQYADADGNQALEQDEVDEATVETLDLSLEQDLNVTFLPDDNNTSDYVGSDFGGQMVLTKGVEYDSIAFQLTDGEGNAVNLTDGIGQKANLNAPVFTTNGVAGDNTNLVNLTATDINGDPVTIGQVYFNETESQPGDGYYVIEDISNINGGNTVVSDGNGFLNTGTGAGDGVFSFYDYGATGEGPQQFWLQITTPDLSAQTEDIATDPFTYSQGQFQVGDPNIETNVTGVAGPDVNGNTWANLSHTAADSFEDVSGIETLTIGINRTYRVNATYESFTGEAINGSNFDRSWIQYDGALSGQPTDVSFEAVRTLGNANATIGGNPTVNLFNGDGEFQFDITVNNSSGTGTFVPKFTANATHNPDYGVTGVYGNNGDTTFSPNASIAGSPDAQNPLVEVYDQSGSELPVNPSADSNNSVLANDVTQTLRVEAFPADADDVPLRGGLKFGFPSTNPISENVVGTTTSTNGTDQPLVTNQFTDQSYDSGQIGFLTLTPTGTGDGILQLINDNDVPVPSFRTRTPTTSSSTSCVRTCRSTSRSPRTASTLARTSRCR